MVKISQLPEVQSISPDDPVVVVADGVTSQAKAALFKGEKGDTGATGPEGPEGPQGPAGPAGEGADLDLLSAYTAKPTDQDIYNAKYINSRLDTSASLTFGLYAQSSSFSLGIGPYTTHGNGSIAIGYGAKASVNQTLAIGYDAKVNTSGTTGSAAIGQYAKVDNSYSVALGSSSVTGRNYEVSVGHKAGDVDGSNGPAATSARTRYLANVTAGQLDTDATNVAQLNAAKQKTWQPNTPYAVGELVVNDGKLYEVTTVYTSGETFDDANLNELGGNSITLHDEFSSDENGANSANFIDTLLNGDALVLGAGSGLGTGISTAVVLGSGAQCSHGSSIALGNNSRTFRSNELSIGNGLEGNPNATRYIANVTAGVNDTDAVNLKQMKDYVAAAIQTALQGTQTS